MDYSILLRTRIGFREAISSTDILIKFMVFTLYPARAQICGYLC